MSLLLDALKKAGQNRQDDATGEQTDMPQRTAELTLEEHPGTSRGQSAQPIPETARNAGKNLFAAKAAPVRARRLRLGIIPIALISGAVLATAGGIYVWYEITPHPVARRVTPPPPPPLPVTRPAPPLIPAPPAVQAPALQDMAGVLPADTPQEMAPSAALATDEPASVPAYREPRIRIESHPQTNSIDPALASAYQSYQQGNFAAAQQQYMTVLQQDAKNRDALLGMAVIAQRQGQNVLAAQYYEYVLALNPRDPVAYAGMTALSRDDSPNEESSLKLLLAQQPQSAALNFALGNLYAAQQRWSEAQQAYFNAYSLQPDSADYAYNLAVSLDHLGQSKSAAQYYQRALQLDSSGAAGFDRAQTAQRLNALKAP
ncbi:MAG: tetratricopeptide repeat protein [Sideroxydans sp.]|nr:tetratricopeptide repeat protein [Sideroxydans sp.]